MNITNITVDTAKDLISLVNKLKDLPKTGKVSYETKSSKKEFKFVELDKIMELIKEDNNFAFMQPLGTTNELPSIQCLLIHKSGESIVSDPYTFDFKEGSSMQDKGSVITYNRRYTASSFFGISSEDDTDGNGVETEKEKAEKEKAEREAKEKAKFQTDITKTFNALITQVGSNLEVYKLIGMTKDEFLHSYEYEPKKLADNLKKYVK